MKWTAAAMAWHRTSDAEPDLSATPIAAFSLWMTSLSKEAQRHIGGFPNVVPSFFLSRYRQFRAKSRERINSPIAVSSRSQSLKSQENVIEASTDGE